MKWRYILLVIVIILAVLLIGLWLLNNGDDQVQQKTESNTEPEIPQLLKALANETGIIFSNIEEAEIKWNIKQEIGIRQITIRGMGFKTQEAPGQTLIKIKQFFGSNGFTNDVYNMAAGTISGVTGYRKDQTACLVTDQLSGFDPNPQDIPPENPKHDIEVGCGQANQSIAHLLSTEEAIRQLLAEKHNTKPSLIIVGVDQEAENHARGGVSFGEPGIGGGLFLAAKVDGQWRLIFDGNGAISCEKVRYYKFPEEMINDCAETQTTTRQVKINKIFTMILPSNPTTGYQWQVNFDSSYLELVKQQYTPSDTMLIGSGGADRFEFKSIKIGETLLIFSYLRPWENKQPFEEQIYKIIIQ
jgi:inhibitor of cysteine peptidase